MGQTAGGLPWPEPSAPVRDGALAIRQLAEVLDPRMAHSDGGMPIRITASSGGYTTNQFGGVAINVPFQTVVMGQGNAQASAYGYTWNRDPAAPAGVVWFQLCDTATKAAVPNVFSLIDWVVMGY